MLGQYWYHGLVRKYVAVFGTIFNDISIVVFKRHGYNSKALSSISTKTYSQFQVMINPINKIHFSSLPSWTWINNREIKISSTDIRDQRKNLRSKH